MDEYHEVNNELLLNTQQLNNHFKTFKYIEMYYS